MLQNLTFKKAVIAGLAILLVLQIAAFALIMHNHKADTKAATDNAAATQLVYNDIDATSQGLSLSVLPKENRLYLPELNVTVPLNLLTRSLRYTYEEGTTGNVRITSANMTDHAIHTQSCSDMVRLRVEAKPDAYGPSQPLYTTINLEDGRTLQVYASTIKECAFAWQAVSPQAIAEQFKAVKTY